MSDTQKDTGKDEPAQGGGGQQHQQGGDDGRGGGAPVGASAASGDAAGASAKLAARIGELERRLAQAQQELNAAALDRGIESALAGSGVIDIETGRLLVEQTLVASPEMSVEEAVGAVRRSKPFLFATGGGGFGGAALAMRGGVGPGDGLATLAEEAVTSGDRADLLRYLRARRGA